MKKNPQFLYSATLLKSEATSGDSFPFNLPVVQNIESIEFHPQVTFFIGENGSGKSTIIEALAVAWGFNAEGGSLNFAFSTKNSHSQLWRYIRLARSHRRPKDGFFLRAESFYNLATEIDELDEEPGGGPPIKNSYGHVSLHEQSHGESFMALMVHRFGGGLYILDEPEAALSPTRQMAMLARLHQLVEQGSQFIIATHSPILMAYPNAKIIQLDDGKLSEISYEESEHFIIMKSFLNNYRSIVGNLLAGDNGALDN